MKTRKSGATGVSQLCSASVRFSFSDEGVGARKACRGKELTDWCDQNARERRALPWVRIA